MTLIFPSALFARAAATGNPGAPAALDLDFAAGRFRVAGSSYPALALVPGYAFARTGEQGAVDSTGAVQWFAANTPAINDRGYHAYGALTNYALRSQEFDNAAWAANLIAVTANAALAPDGTMTADTLNAGTVNSNHYIYQAFPLGAAGVHTVSVFVKAGTARYVQLVDDHDGTYTYGANFDLQTLTVTQQAAGWAGYIVPIGGGWYRLVGVFSAVGPGTANAYLSMIGSGTAGRVGAYAAASETLHAWQLQVIPGSFPDGGPLIRTAGATASIGASDLRVAVANGDYSAVYTFDDGSTQTIPTTVSGGQFAHPVAGTLSRAIVKRVVVTAA